MVSPGQTSQNRVLRSGGPIIRGGGIGKKKQRMENVCVGRAGNEGKTVKSNSS